MYCLPENKQSVLTGYFLTVVSWILFENRFNTRAILIRITVVSGRATPAKWVGKRPSLPLALAPRDGSYAAPLASERAIDHTRICL